MAIKTDSSQVVMYASKLCGYCTRAQRLLKGKTDKLSIIYTDGNPKMRTELKSKTGSHTVPQIWIGDKYVGGCDDLFQLDGLKKLDAMLEAL